MGIGFAEFFRSVEKYNEPQINADERRFVNPVSAFIDVASAVNRTKGIGGNWKVVKSHYNLGISHLLYLLVRFV